MPIITPNYNARLNAASDYELEQATDTPRLDLMKEAIEGIGPTAREYASRCETTEDWWYARWPNQTADGRRWALDDNIDAVWPWQGASDSRVRLCERLVAERSLIGKYALMNQKVQAKSSRPFASQRESQQMTTLMNWMLFTHMGVDLHLELNLMLACRHGFGSAVTEACWEQERRLEYVPISMMSLGEFVKRVGQELLSDAQQGSGYGGQGAEGKRTAMMSDKQIALGFMTELAQTRSPLLELQDMILNEEYAEDLARVIQAMSPIVTKRQAFSILAKLRDFRTAEVPVPYVFKSQPKRTTLRPMIDVFFPRDTGNLQRARWIARIERVDVPTLEDRVETAEYDPGFVDLVKGTRGPSKTGGFGDGMARLAERGPLIVGPGGRNVYGDRDGSDLERKIELIHFHMLVHDRGVPVLFSTTFHMDHDVAATHGPCEYDHGQHQFHGHRNETNAREILSSRGVPDIFYTAEQELKKQIDGRTDRVDLALKPPLFTTYEAMQKVKGMSPGDIIPMRKFDESEFMKPPMWDPGSTEVEKAIERRVQDHQGLFGAEVDPQKKQLNQQTLADDILTEEKPIIMQIGQLCKQLLPDERVTRVVGPLSRPFHLDRADIQGQFEYVCTVDMRELDAEWMSKKAAAIGQILGIDTTGVADRAAIVTNLFQGLDYSLADMAIKDQQQATQSEVQDEMQAFSIIVGSGRDQPLPQGGNYQLRLQTLQNELQKAMTSDPDFSKRVQAFPGIMKVLQTRMQFFQRQLQQRQNAQIGRIQVGETFTGQAPALQDAGAMMQ